MKVSINIGLSELLFDCCLMSNSMSLKVLKVQHQDTVSFLAHLYESTGKTIAVTMASALIKVCKRLYFLNLWMEVVHTCPDVTYWSEVLCCTTPTHDWP